MKAMLLEETASLDQNPDPLRLVDLERPEVGPKDLLLRVSACGVCHTELDEIEGRLSPRLPIVPGHEVIGNVVEIGQEVAGWDIGDRAGVGWIYRSSGEQAENLSSEFRATGCDVNGGYAEFVVVPADYAVPVPEGMSDAEAAPLMCAGAIGYRALKLTSLSNGEALGLMGFGGSGHLVLQIAKHLYPESPIYVFTRGESVQAFAKELGADWAGGIADTPPEKVSAIIDTTPVWKPVIESLKKLRPGGRLVINAIRKEDSDKDELLNLNYHEHLWMEREIKSVANLTHADIAEFLPLAAFIPIHPKVSIYPLEKANEALRDLRAGNIHGANVLIPSL